MWLFAPKEHMAKPASSFTLCAKGQGPFPQKMQTLWPPPHPFTMGFWCRHAQPFPASGERTVCVYWHLLLLSSLAFWRWEEMENYQISETDLELKDNTSEENTKLYSRKISMLQTRAFALPANNLFLFCSFSFPLTSLFFWSFSEPKLIDHWRAAETRF